MYFGINLPYGQHAEAAQCQQTGMKTLDGTNVCMPENENMFYSKYFTHECFGSETYGIPCESEIDFS